MKFLEDAIRKIESQQPKEHTTVWCCGEQLKDILRGEPELAEIVAQDLENKSMTIAECEKKIKARADEIHKTARGSSSSAVSPSEAEEIIRKFYGLPERKTAVPAEEAEISGEKVVDLADFF